MCLFSFNSPNNPHGWYCVPIFQWWKLRHRPAATSETPFSMSHTVSPRFCPIRQSQNRSKFTFPTLNIQTENSAKQSGPHCVSGGLGVSGDCLEQVMWSYIKYFWGKAIVFHGYRSHSTEVRLFPAFPPKPIYWNAPSLHKQINCQ